MKLYYDHAGIQIFHGDCREVLPTLGPVDLVLTDPPYGLTANEWDGNLSAAEITATLRPFKTVVMTASNPFAAQMVCADASRYRHEWVWIKDRGSNFANTVREPMKEHELVLVFSDARWTYNPQPQKRTGSGKERVRHPVASRTASTNYRQFEDRGPVMRSDKRCPSSWQKWNRDRGLHPTQKPLAMMSYLIATYSNVGEIILDPFVGSGTTLVGAKQLHRKAIGIEIEEKYCEIAVNRLAQEVLPFAGVTNG